PPCAPPTICDVPDPTPDQIPRRVRVHSRSPPGVSSRSGTASLPACLLPATRSRFTCPLPHYVLFPLSPAHSLSPARPPSPRSRRLLSFLRPRRSAPTSSRP